MRNKNRILLLALTVLLALSAAVGCQSGKKFTVTVVGGTGGGRFDAGAQCTVTATVGDDERFIGWRIGERQVSEANPYTFTVNESVTIAAVVEPKSYTVTVVGGAGSGQYSHGAQCTVTATVDEGEDFVGWMIDEIQVSDANPYTFTVNESVTITAVTKVKIHTVTVNGGTGGGEYPHGERCTVTATAGEGEWFAGWWIGDRMVSEANPYSFTVTEDTIVTAELKPRVSAGVFARRWISGTEVLDLAAETLTGAHSLVVTSVTGQGAQSVITCRIDGADYRLTLNQSGALEMRAASAGESSQPEAVFLAAPDEFSGVWTFEDEVYTLFITEPDENGNFGWVNLEPDGSYDEDMLYSAITRFVFDDAGNPAIEYFVNTTKVVYVMNQEGNVTLPEEDLVFTPAEAVFGSAYASESGRNIVIDRDTGSVTVNGVATDYAVGKGAYGAGLVYTLDGTDYTLVYTFYGVYECSENGRERMFPYSVSWLMGDWLGEGSISATSADKISYRGKEYPLNAAVVGEEVVLSFNAEGHTYLVSRLDDNNVAIVLTESGASAVSYYVSSRAAAQFIGVYDGNPADALTVGSDYQVTLNGQSYAGRFAFLPDLDRGIASSIELQGLPNVAIKLDDGRSLVWAGKGILALAEGDAGNYRMSAGYFTQEAIAALGRDFADGLSSDNDCYTTGGVNRQTLTFDFAAARVIFNGAEYAFSWSYFSRADTAAEYPVISFREAEGGKETEYLVYRYFDSPYIRLEEYTEGERSQLLSLVSGELYTELLGTTYVLKGEIFDESISFSNDGTLTLITADTTASSQATKSESFVEYVLTREPSGVLVVTFTSGIFETSIYCDEIGRWISMGMDRYTVENLDAGQAAGVYYDGEGAAMVELLSSGQFRYTGYELDDAAAAEDFDTLTLKDGVLTGIKEYQGLIGSTSVTMTFRDGTVEVSEDSAELATYVRKELTPKSFVGTYTLIDEEWETLIVIKAVAETVNSAIELSITVDGDPVSDVSLRYLANDRQELSFRHIFTTYYAVLDGSSITFRDHFETDYLNAVQTAAPAWDFSRFVLNESAVLTDEDGSAYTLTCISKAGGKMPLFYLRASDGSVDMRLQTYTVSICDGSFLLDVSTMGFSVRITADMQGNVSAGFTPIEEEAERI